MLASVYARLLRTTAMRLAGHIQVHQPLAAQRLHSAALLHFPDGVIEMRTQVS